MTPQERYELIRQRTMDEIRKQGWTRKRLGDAVGVEKMQPTRWGTGENIPSLEAAPTLAKVLGVSLSYLAAAGEDEPEQLAIELLRQLTLAEKDTVVKKLAVWVEATVAARQPIADTRPAAAEPTSRPPGEPLVSGAAPAGDRGGPTASEYPIARPRPGRGPRKRPPA